MDWPVPPFPTVNPHAHSPHIHLAGAERLGQEKEWGKPSFQADTTFSKVRLLSHPARQPAWCLMSAPGQMTGPGLLATGTPDVPGSLTPITLSLEKKKVASLTILCACMHPWACVCLHTRAAPLSPDVNSTRSHRQLSLMKWKVEHKSVSAALLAMHQQSAPGWFAR